MPHRRDPNKPKPAFMDMYNRPDRQYDPSVEGYGNPEQWNAAFRTRLGLDEAKRVLKDLDPWTILGVSRDATWHEIRKAYKKLAAHSHPDWQANHPEEKLTVDDFKQIQAAYEILEARYKK